MIRELMQNGNKSENIHIKSLQFIQMLTVM